MPRITRKIFYDLSIWMIAFGIITGIIFPFFLLILGLPESEVLQGYFFSATIMAGILVALFNYLLANWVIRPRLRTLVDGMKNIQEAIRAATLKSDWSNCDGDKCHIACDSDDEIGESANAFNALVYELIRSQEMESAASDFSKTLSSKLELEDLTKDGLNLLLSHTGTIAGIVFTDNEGEFSISANRGIKQPEAVLNSPQVRHALRGQEIVHLEIPDNIVVEGVLTDFRPHDIILIPTTFKMQTLGLVIVASSHPVTSEALKLCELFRQGFGLALNNALTHDRLQRTAALDPLTNCYNRRFGLGRLGEEFKRAIRDSAPLGLLMFDLDHFKSINDTYGHLVGDRVLSKVSETTRSALREGDIVIRYGGEEFLVLLPGASTEDAAASAERIRRLIEETVIMDAEQKVNVTISAGYTSFPNDSVEDTTELIRHADEALYAAKDGGRNQVRPYN
ncbi:MAG: diguanylate cyclase [Candidatus Sedimenticola sp. 6PFRAG7]